MNLKSFMGIKQKNQKKKEWLIHGGKGSNEELSNTRP